MGKMMVNWRIIFLCHAWSSRFLCFFTNQIESQMDCLMAIQALHISLLNVRRSSEFNCRK